MGTGHPRSRLTRPVTQPVSHKAMPPAITNQQNNPRWYAPSMAQTRDARKNVPVIFAPNRFITPLNT